MRHPRIHAPDDLEVAFYHCVSRVVDRRRVLGPVEKERFRELMRFYERFSCVQVAAYCLMDNHFHLLVAVPRRPVEPPSESWLLEHIGRCYGERERSDLADRLELLRRTGGAEEAEALLERYRARLWNISAYLKTLKQRFTQWFNGKHDRTGTLWEGRFRSTLIEGTGDVLATVAAYIDLNPVRAGLVDDPADYPWCGYGEAMGGSAPRRRHARRAVSVLVGAAPGKAEGVDRPGGVEAAAGLGKDTDEDGVLERALADYRLVLFGRAGADQDPRGGARDPAAAEAGAGRRRSLDPVRVAEVLAAGGRLGRLELLRCRIRYFTRGVAIGSREFVDRVFADSRSCFGASRVSGARRMLRAEALGVFALRQPGGGVEVPVLRPPPGAAQR